MYTCVLTYLHICAYCKGALDRRDEIITKNVKQINDVLETLKSNFIDNQGDFAELLVEEDNKGVMADLIEKKMNEKPEAVEDAIFSIIKHIADCNEDVAAPSFSNYEDDTAHYDKVIIELTIKNLDLPKNTPKTRECISFAYYKKFHTMVLKNMARTTSNNTKSTSTTR